MTGYVYYDTKHGVRFASVNILGEPGVSPTPMRQSAARLLGELAWTCRVDNAQIGFQG